MTTITNEYDLIILGAGPTGLFGAFYANINNLKTLILERDNIYGGSPLKLYPDKPIYDLPSIIKINGKDFVDNLYQQLSTKSNWEIKYNQNVTEIIKIEENKFKIVANDQDFFCKNIIICIGYGSFKFKSFSDHIIKINDLSVIHHFVNDLNTYHNKKIVICGGGNSALEYANLLCPVVGELSLIHHTNNLKGMEHNLISINEDNKINKFFNNEILEINNKYILVQNKQTQITNQIEYDYILTFYGTELVHSKIYEINIWNKKRKIEVNDYFESILMSGLYCCGACNDKKYNNLIINCMSQITIAIDHIKGGQRTH